MEYRVNNNTSDTVEAMAHFLVEMLGKGNHSYIDQTTIQPAHTLQAQSLLQRVYKMTPVQAAQMDGTNLKPGQRPKRGEKMTPSFKAYIDTTQALPQKGFIHINDGLAIRQISERGRNQTDFYYFGNHYRRVLVVDRKTGRHAWTVDPGTLAIPDWVRIAFQEVGVSEIVGKKHDSQVMEYHHAGYASAETDEVPWCASFVNWVLGKAGLPLSATGIAATRSSSFDDYGQQTSKNKPVFGCIARFKRKGGGHVGFVVGKIGKSLAILGGNQSNQVSVTAKSMNQLVACRWPTGAGGMTAPEDLREYENQFGMARNAGSEQ
ncbi:hypothetical protein GCM10028807_45070 [Spirosoma daeguense]